MSNIFINYLPTPEFQSYIIIMCPSELYREQILQTNIKNLIALFKKYIAEEDLLNGNKAVLSICKFDSQKNKQQLIVEENENKLQGIYKEMNSGISPYFWKIYRDVDTYDYEAKMQIKADYVLALEK